ncbi:hypothetical protein [Terrabacter carboxydivorans]|uniref:hypothetical protein n=1 Tax=Terrabacter carboxydivorans TaxID=619730 RepID=UPI0031E207FD
MLSSTTHGVLGSMAPRTMRVIVTPGSTVVVVRVSGRPAGPSGSAADAAYPV